MRPVSTGARRAALVAGLLVLVVPGAVACCAEIVEAHSRSCCASIGEDPPAGRCCEGKETPTTVRLKKQAEPLLPALLAQPAVPGADPPARPGGRSARAFSPDDSGPAARHVVMLL